MPKILLSLSAVLIIVAAVFSGLTKPQIAKIQAEKLAATDESKTAKQDAEKSKKEATTAKEQAATERLRADTVTKDKNDLKSQLESTQKQLAEANTKAATVTAQVEELNKKLADAGKENSGVSSAALTELQGKLKEAETKLGELETVNQTLTQKNTDTENKLANLEKAERSRANKVMVKGLTGQVLAVNRAYNFVVISMGDKQGVVMNGEMLIKRAGAQVAKVKITSVEPTTSIADVVPGSVNRGNFVQAGDEVIYPGAGI